MTKPLGERVARVEAWFVAHTEVCEGHFREIKEHLEKLNGDVADNSKFRLQQKTVYGVMGFIWISVFIPVVMLLLR